MTHRITVLRRSSGSFTYECVTHGAASQLFLALLVDSDVVSLTWEPPR